jgi:hypothetical protein
MPKTKICTECQTDKSLDEYYIETRNKADGRKSKCKTCVNARQSVWRSENKDRIKASNAAYKSANVELVRESQRRTALKLKYGITPEQYDEMLLNQDGKCAICATDNPGGANNTFHIDHDHETGRVRGLLCHKCNRSIGFLGDNAVGVARALAYLQRSES